MSIDLIGLHAAVVGGAIGGGGALDAIADMVVDICEMASGRVIEFAFSLLPPALLNIEDVGGTSKLE